MGERKKKKGQRRKKKGSAASNHSVAIRYVSEWAPGAPRPSPAGSGDGFLPAIAAGTARLPVFELHSHSNHSDGFLSPSALVARAHRNGVKVLSLTDHDTMAGIPEAVNAASEFGMKIIPGVEISAVYSPREESGREEHVHILAYYGCFGPTRHEELESLLASIRDGRYLRAKNMLLKLNKLNMPLKWEHIIKIAGDGVAPGRLHVARALVEAGHVENLRQAFSRYLYDGGPAYATGTEPFAEEVVHLICRTGGVAALAHPWALKNPDAVIRNLKAAGLHAMEVYSSEGKSAGFSDFADTYELLKLGGSDYHGRGGTNECDLGSVNLPLTTVYEFLKTGRPIWCNAIKDILLSFSKEPSKEKLETLMRFSKPNHLQEYSTSSYSEDALDCCLSSWLTSEEREAVKCEDIRLKLSQVNCF